MKGKGVSPGRGSESPDEAVCPLPHSPALSFVALGVFCPEGGRRAGHPLERILPLVLGRCGETCKPSFCFQKSSKLHSFLAAALGRKQRPEPGEYFLLNTRDP